MRTYLIFALLLLPVHLCSKEVHAYYINSNAEVESLYVDKLPFDLFDTLIYAPLGIDEKGNITLSQPKIDLYCCQKTASHSTHVRGNLHLLADLKQKARLKGKILKTLFSLQGEEGSLFPQVLADVKTRRKLIASILAFCDKFQFDGVDIDWEYPQTQNDIYHFTRFAIELRHALSKHRPSLLMTIAAPASYDLYHPLPWRLYGKLYDAIHLMTYDFHGPWKDEDNLVTNHQAAILSPSVGNPALNVTSAIKDFINWVAADKLFVGVPFYFNCYADAKQGELPSHYASSYSGPTLSDDPSLEGKMSYRHIMDMLESKKAEKYWDSTAAAFSAYLPKNAIFASGINDQSLKLLVEIVDRYNLGGVMIWEIGGDTKKWHALCLINALLRQN